MSLSLIVVSLGTAAAAAGTGVLVIRCARSPRAHYVAWALALLGLTVALGSQLIGDLSGYDDLLFRAMELGAQMVAPLALCLSLVEVVGQTLQARFAMRLAVCALAVIGVVILGTDPLSLTVAFSKAWPDPALYYQLWPKAVLYVLAPFTFVTAAGAVGIMRARSRHDDDAKAATGAVIAASIAAASLAVPGLAMIAQSAAGVSLPLSGRSVFALACTGAAVLSWLAGRQAARLDRAGAGARAGARRSGRDDDWLDERGRGADETGAGEPYETGEYGGFDPASRGAWLDQADRAGRHFEPDSGVGPWDNSYRDEADHDWGKPGGVPLDESGTQVRYPGLAALAAETDRPPGGGRFDDNDGFDQADRGYREGDRYDDEAGGFDDPDRYDDRGRGDGYSEPGRPYGRDPYESRPDTISRAELFGQITIYTLIEERTSEFDRLTERVVAQVKDQEPGTLAYIVHAVPTAPMQRILYEVYRDRVAYDDHLRQPYIAAYEIERRPLVLATNVIELGLQQAKVSAFPSFSAISDILSESGIDLTGVTRSSGRPPGPAPQSGSQPRPVPPAPPIPHEGPWSDPRSAAAGDPAYHHHYKGWDEIRGEDERYR